MNLDKKLKQGIALSISILVLVCTALTLGGTNAEASAELTAAGTHAKAGMIATLEASQNSALDQVQVANASVEKTQTDVVTLASKSEAQEASEETDAAGGETLEGTDVTDDEAQETSGEAEAPADKKQETAEGTEAGKEEEKTLSKTEQEWQDKVMADVDDSLCIRAKGDEDAKILGKLYPTSVATVIKEGKSWTKIESGSVKGYVKNKYLLFGEDAYENAKKVCKKYAFVQTDGLRVRSKAKEDAKVLTVADKGDKLLYDSKAKKADGWVAVKVKAGNGYVSEEFVKVKLGTTKAVSIEEEIAAKEEAEAKAAISKNLNSAPEDVRLLSAIIQCEAGSECYQGKVAVGAVVLNRVRSSRYPNTISGVIYQSGQFSPVRNGALARVLASGNISSACRQAAADALAGADPTGGKLFFHRVDGSSGLVIGNHVFY